MTAIPFTSSLSQLAVRTHSLLTSLSDDDHTQYALLAGRSTNQTINGATSSAGTLTLSSTAHATKGKATIATVLTVDEATLKVGINNVSPTGKLDVVAGAGQVAVRAVGVSGQNVAEFHHNAGALRIFVDNNNQLVSSSTLSLRGTSVRMGTVSADFMVLASTSLSFGSSDFQSQWVFDYATVASPVLRLKNHSSAVINRDIATIRHSYVDSTDATRKGRLVLSAADASGSDKEGLRIESSGTAPLIGFLGAVAVVRQTLSAAGTDAATTQTLANSLRTALINLGLGV